MSEASSGPTISLRERTLRLGGSEERLPKWFAVSLVSHLILIAAMFLAPMLPSRPRPAPAVTVVDLVGGERIGGTNFGTELSAPKQPAKTREEPPAPAIKNEVKKPEPPPKEEKTKVAEKKAPPEEKIAIKEKAKPEPAKTETTKETRKEATKEDSKSETASADSVRERLLQSALDRAKTRTEGPQKSTGEPLSAGSGEGVGAAGLGPGGRGGPGVVRGMDFVIYQNRMFATIKENWSWVGGQRSNLRVVVHFGVKENGEIVGLKIMQPSGDPSYDESVLRAVKKSSPLPVPPEAYRKDFAEVQVTFRPQDLGA